MTLFSAEESAAARMKTQQVRVHTGDVWILGEHTLFCADGTKPENAAYLTQNKPVELVFTDPPYLQRTADGGGYARDTYKKTFNTIRFISDFKPEKFLEVLKGLFPDGRMNAYIFCNKALIPAYLNFAQENRYNFDLLFWKKPPRPTSMHHHTTDLEYLVFLKRRAVFNNFLPNAHYGKCLSYGIPSKEFHPATKPVELIKNEVLISSREGAYVADLFGGGGSTLMACELAGRRCLMTEILPEYCERIIRRFEITTQRRAVKFTNIPQD